ncbi:hypothetical protein [Streptomyces sp. NPDC014995]|uniref:hypothetical protein n=1 Tax=Streptomyces sp. NPDC014995 TaxID=3364936 RepID=UPI0036FCA450
MVREPVEQIAQIAQPVAGKEGSLLRPAIKPLRRGLHPWHREPDISPGLPQPSHGGQQAIRAPAARDFGSRPFGRADDLPIRQEGQPLDRRLP